MKIKQIVGEHKKGVRAKIYTKKPQNTVAPAKPKKPEGPVSEDAKITKSDTTGVEITADDGVKTTLPPEKAAALTPDPSNPNEYDLNPTATSPTGDTPQGPKVGANVEIKTAEDAGDDGDPPIDSAESYKAWLQKSAANSGLSPKDTAGLMNMLVTEPDGSIDMDATMVNSIKEFSNFMPQLLEMFTEWIGIMEQVKADPAQWSTLTPEEQKSIDDAIADGKAQLPAMQSQIKQMQAQMPELDQAMAARKTAGNNIKIPAKTPLPELARIQELAGTDTKSKYDSLSNDPDSEFYGLPDEAIEILMQMQPSIKVDPNAPSRDLLEPTRDTKWPQFAELMKQIDALKDQGKNYDAPLSQAMAIPGPVKITDWFRAYAETLPQNAQPASIQESTKTPAGIFRKLLTILEAPLEKNVDSEAPTKKSWGTEFIKPAPGQADQITPATPAAPKAAPKAAPHKYVPGAKWNKGVLGFGSTGPEVDELRGRLGLAPNGGKFDNETRDAVIQRQKELGVTADGAWGPGTARADAAKPKKQAPSAGASANDGDAGEAEARANRDRMTTPGASANDGDAGEAEARANRGKMPALPPNSISRAPSKTDAVEVNINGYIYKMFLNSDGHYYIPGENIPRERNGKNVYRPGERMPMQGPKTAPFPRGYQGASQTESADNQLLKTMLTIAGLRP